MELMESAEWGQYSPAINGKDVYRARKSGVSKEWLSRCKEERALTENLMEKVTDLSNLSAALRQVVSNRGSAGVDGMGVTELKGWFSREWRWLQTCLINGQYIPSPVKKVTIPKPNGGRRILGIPTVVDRLVQQAISQVLTKHYDSSFSKNSYGFRIGRSAHGALQSASRVVEKGNDWIVDIDLEKFFDTVNHDRLIWLLGTRIGDKRVLGLIRKFLNAGMLEDGLVSQRIQGTPQGSPLSPILSNILLDELDKELEHRGHRFVRYADDMIIMTASKETAQRVLQRTTRLIEKRLCLKVNHAKSRICRSKELNFLGYNILPDGRLGLSEMSATRLKAKLRVLTKRNRGISLEQLVRELNAVIRGWVQYFKYARMSKRLRTIESWLNRKIRCFKLHQCKRALGIARFVNKLGVPWKRSWTTAGSSIGWFRKSMTHAAHEGMNTKWLRTIGLISLHGYYSLKFKETAQYERRTLGGVRGQQS